MSKKIFISYNHKDQACALKIKDRLVATGWGVLIDVERMQSGENIEQFIMDCIQESDVTLSLISTNSLLSAWVAVETMATDLAEKMKSHRFIPCYIDADFFDRNFVSKSLTTIETHLKEIMKLMVAALEKEWGIEDLQNERTRYLKLKTSLPEIVGKLRSLLCINLASEQFEPGIQKILSDLGWQDTVGKITDPPIDLFQNTLDEEKKQRLIIIKNQLQQLQQLLYEYEEKRMLSDDPIERMKCDKQIKKLTGNIQLLQSERHTITNTWFLATKNQVLELQQLLYEYEEKRTLLDDPMEQMRCNREIEKITGSIQQLKSEMQTTQNPS